MTNQSASKSFFDGRERIEAKSLRGPRVYSTDLRPNLYLQDRADEILGVTAQSLKIKILTKGVVTINSAHLVSPFAVRFLERHPDLVRGQALLPAFRTDKASLEDLVSRFETSYKAEGITTSQLDDHLQLLRENVRQVMPWELGDVAELYRSRLLEGLEDDGSLLLKMLSQQSVFDERVRKDIIDTLKDIDLSESRRVHEFIETLPQSISAIMGPYDAACYHLVGTEVVRCETGTDLNPLSRLKASDVLLTSQADQRQLSEENVFLNYFFGYALDVINAARIPSAVLDVIDFETAHRLSEALREQGFQDAYEEVLTEFVATLSKPDKQEALEHLDAIKIAEVARELSEKFHRYIDGEVKSYRTRAHRDDIQDAIEAGTDTAFTALGAVPVVGNIVSVIQGAYSAAGSAKSTGSALANRDHATALTKARERRAAEINSIIENVKSRDKAKLLEAAAALTDVYATKVRRA